MGVEHGIKLVTVIFPKTGKTLQAELINAQDIKKWWNLFGRPRP